MTHSYAKRFGLAAALGFLMALFAAPASAGVATSGAVLLDPFDPVPEIQFHHFGGYGCSYGCGYSDCDGCGGWRGCRDNCGYSRYDGCYDGCRRHVHYRRHCDDDCDRGCRDRCEPSCRDRCERGCDRDCDRHCDHGCDRDDRTADAPACTSERCYNAEHYERRWRDGDRVGQEWLDRGTRERTIPDGGHSGGYYGRENSDWRDDDDNGPPPPPPPPPDDHHHH